MLSVFMVCIVIITSDEAEEVEPEDAMKPDPEIEKQLLRCLSEASLTLPTTSRELAADVGKQLGRHIFHIAVVNLLQKFTTQQLIV
jgi:mRNA (2'-O-methyladenosine-N6-)-methyltransferase